MIQGGVQGFFRKALGDEQLIKCIRVVARGETWFDAVLITQVLDQCTKEVWKNKDQLKSLTHSESGKTGNAFPAGDGGSGTDQP